MIPGCRNRDVGPSGRCGRAWGRGHANVMGEVTAAQSTGIL